MFVMFMLTYLVDLLLNLSFVYCLLQTMWGVPRYLILARTRTYVKSPDFLNQNIPNPDTEGVTRTKILVRNFAYLYEIIRSGPKHLC